MTAVVLLKRSSTPGLIPGADELVAGQLALNTHDAILYTLNSSGVVTAIAGGTSEVMSVNSVTPVSGNVTLTPANLGATTVGNAVFTATTAAAAVTALGGSTVGAAVFTATSAAAGVTALGGSTVGSAVFTAASTGAAQTAIGASTLGAQIFTAANAAAVLTDLGATTIGSGIFGATSTSSAQSILGASTLGAELFTATSAANAVTDLGATTVGAAVFTATSAAAAQTAIGATTVGSTLFTETTTAAALTYLGGIATTQINVANGVAPLDSNGLIPLANIPASLIGAVDYQAPFIPGTTTLPAAATGNKGWYYIASTAGTYTPPSGTLLTFAGGDYLISNGTAWSTISASGSVTSVNGQTGAVVLTAASITSGTFAAAQLGASSGDNLVLTTSGAGAPTWVATLAAGQLGASTGNNLILSTNGSGASTWVSTVPYANLPVATASALGLAEAGSGLSVTAGVFSVNTSALTLDEGTYTGS